MVEYLDLSIGRLFDFLQKNDLYDNTLILFLSDNGANGAHATAYPGNGDGSYLASFNNDLDNRGLPNSFIEMGPGWASASSAPMRLFKSFTTQGGIKAPCIAKLPGKMAIGGQWSSEFVHVTDIMPTVLELAETNYPLVFAGKEVRKPIGRSMVPLLRAEVNTHLPSKGIGYELFEMRAYLQEEWKLLRLPEPFGTGDWQIFNLRNDPGEVEDLSATNPDIKAKLIEAYERYARENDVFDHQGRFDALYRQAYGAKAREQ